MQRITAFMRRDGWIIAAIFAAILLCLTTSSTPDASSTTAELRLARVLSAMEGAGSVEVAIYYAPENAALPCGAVIVADGAGDIAVRLRLTRAVSTLLGIGSNRVEVFQRKGGTTHGQPAP